jgi:hypothetical protein
MFEKICSKIRQHCFQKKAPFPQTRRKGAVFSGLVYQSPVSHPAGDTRVSGHIFCPISFFVG